MNEFWGVHKLLFVVKSLKRMGMMVTFLAGEAFLRRDWREIKFTGQAALVTHYLNRTDKCTQKKREHAVTYTERNGGV